MSRTIDERVVEMRFDNKEFERNVHTSLSTLDKLKEKLNLTGASKGLDEVNKAASKVDLNPLSHGVETVGLKFNALYTIADHALRRITDRAMDAGERLVKSLTIDPIKTGFDEYETKINSIQTIMSNTASKGTTMEDVTKVIGELNTYADKTIYNFAEMTRNIGTFTAAGIGLEDSAASIQGIANLAASSGSTSQQASTAMYQLSQAMAAGTVKLMDWNSVVNAGMGGEKFQNALKATAKEHGVAVDEIIEKNGSFRESLSEGWITADILNETLRKFTVDGAKEYADSMIKSGKYTQEQADALIKEAQAMEDAATKVKTFTQLIDTLKESAQSGWSQTWEIIVGDFEEAKAMLTKVSDTLGGIIGASADARNELLTDWKNLGGRNDLLDSFVNIFESIKSIVTPIKEAFRDIFPPMTAERLKAITENIAKFTASLKLSDVASDNLKRTFRGLFAIINIVKMAFSAVYKLLKPVIGLVVKLAGKVLELTAGLGDWFTNLNSGIETLNTFDRIAQYIIDSVGELWSVLREKFVSPSLQFLGSFIEGLRDEMGAVGGAATKMRDVVSRVLMAMATALESNTVYQFLKNVWKLLVAIGRLVGDLFGKAFNGLMTRMENADFQGIFEFIEGISVAAIAIYMAKFVKGLKKIGDSVGSLMDGFKDTVDSFNEILNTLKGTLKAFTAEIKSRALMNIAKAIMILVAALFIVALIDKDDLMNGISAITILFVEIIAAMNMFSKVGDIKGGMGRAALVMIGMSVAVLLLASAMKKITELNFEEMLNGLIGVGALLAGVSIAAKYLASSDSATILKGATRIIVFALAIKILAGVVKDLGDVDILTLLKGLAGVAALLAGTALAVKFMAESIKKSNFSKATIGIIALAMSIKILASACAILADLSWTELLKGLIGVGVLLAGLTVAVKVIATSIKHTNFSKSAGAILAIAAALAILTLACKSLAKLSWGGLAKGLIGVTVLLAGLTASVAIMDRMIKKASLTNSIAAMLAMAVSITILARACKSLAKLSWGELLRGLIGIGASMAILAVGLKAIQGTTKGSLALLVAAAALAVLAPVLMVLGSMSIGTIVTGLLAMAGAFAVLGIAGALLAPLAGAIITLAGAIALIGAGVLLFGIGLSAISVGLVALGAALAVGAAGIVAGIKVIILGILEMIPAVIRVFGDMIVALCEAISKSAVSIGRAITDVIVATVNTIVESSDVIVEGLLKIIVSVLDSLVKYAPEIVGLLIDLVVNIVDILIGRIPTLVGKFTELVGAFIDALMAAFGSVDTTTLLEGIACITLVAVLVHLVASVTKKVPKALVGLAALSLVVLELAAIFAAFGALAQIPGVEWIITEGANFMKLIGEAMLQSIVAFGLASALMIVASALSGLIAPALIGIAGLALIIAEMTAVFALFGGLAQIPGLQWLVEEGGAFIATVTKVLGEIIGSFVGGLIGGVGVGITDSLVVMAQNLSLFMEEIQPFIDGAMGIDPAIVKSIGALAAAVVLLTGADILNSLTSFITGGVNFSGFAQDFVLLGEGLKGFSEATQGVDPAVVKNAAEAAKTLVDMTNAIPNSGGLISWFAGDNSIAKFSSEIVTVGHGLKGFSDAIVGIVPANIVAAADAAKALAEMTAIIPNSGGMAAWFSGENSVARFAMDIVNLGHGLKGFSVAVMGIVPENVIAAANAAKALAEMASVIPNQGGMVAWFTGDNSLSKFSGEIVNLGYGLKGFSVAVMGINPENVMAAANAAKSLAEMASVIPNQGGMAAWFAGDNSISKFSGELASLGAGLRGFSASVAGIVPENVVAAANASKALAEMTAIIPNEGGMKSWFSGESGVVAFADRLPPLGKGLKGFSTSVQGINPENVTAAANAAKALGEMTAVIPKEGGVKAWFSGETSIANFADKLPTLGKGLKKFSESVAGINPENTTAASKAAKNIGDLVKDIPGDPKKLTKFSDNLEDFGKDLKSYFSTMSKISPESLSSSNNALKAVKEVSKIDAGNISAVSKALNKLTESAKKMAKDIKADFKDSGKEAIEAYIKGIKDKLSSAKTAIKDVVSDCAKAASDKATAFTTAGRDVVIGFANGISENTYRAEAKARAMARAAADAAEDELDINSPSKVFRNIAYSVPEGFALGIDKLSGIVVASSASMGDLAIDGVKSSIARLANVINGDMDVQPTIRPVLDLSDVRAGAGSISRMFGSGSSLGVSANINAISSSMNRQNGGNGDVISAIDKLRDDLKNVNNTTYTINGITYDDGSNIAEAVKSIVRAAKVERRI